MKETIRQLEVFNGKVVMTNKTISEVKVSSECIMSIDGSTSNTGVAIIRKADSALQFSCAFKREEGETPVQYKVRLKKKIEGIILNNTLIEHIYYEEPFVGYASSVANLMMLRTFVEELIVENEPVLNYIKHKEINNKKWKKLFLLPEKCPIGTDLEKKAVKDKLLKYMPALDGISQDEIDAIAMGMVANAKILDNSEDELQSKKKTRPFKYNIKFIGANEDEDMMLEFGDVYNGPSYLLENGITLTTVKGTENFDKHIYKEMGDSDKVLIVKFDSSKHCNVVLQYKIGALSAMYDYIYAIVWRLSRK